VLNIKNSEFVISVSKFRERMASSYTSQSAILQEDEFWASIHCGVQDEVTKTIPEEELSPINL
jgi:hypothetical protein